jgi:hypothetical protein
LKGKGEIGEQGIGGEKQPKIPPWLESNLIVKKTWGKGVGRLPHGMDFNTVVLSFSFCLSPG